MDSRPLATCFLALLVLGCEVESDVVFDDEARAALSLCKHCISDDPPVLEDAAVDTIIVTTYRLADEVDCRSCAELGECVIEQRSCICLGRPERVADIDFGAQIAGLSVEDLDRNQEYCIAIATVLAGDQPGPSCECAPEKWTLESDRATMSCTYTRQAKRPQGDPLRLNETVCQNPTGRSGIPLPNTDSTQCVYADFYSEMLRTCAGVIDPP